MAAETADLIYRSYPFRPSRLPSYPNLVHHSARNSKSQRSRYSTGPKSPFRDKETHPGSAETTDMLRWTKKAAPMELETLECQRGREVAGGRGRGRADWAGGADAEALSGPISGTVQSGVVLLKVHGHAEDKKKCSKLCYGLIWPQSHPYCTISAALAWGSCLKGELSLTLFLIDLKSHIYSYS